MQNKEGKEDIQDQKVDSRLPTQEKKKRQVEQNLDSDIMKTVKQVQNINTKQQNNNNPLQIQKKTSHQNVSNQQQQQQQQQLQQFPQQRQQQQEQQNAQAKQIENIQSSQTQLNQDTQNKSSLYFQNSEQLRVQDPLRASIQKDNFETEFREIFLMLDKRNKIINPLKFVINQNIVPSNPDVLFYVLSDQMRRANRSFFKSLEPNDQLLYSFQGQFTADSKPCSTYSLILQETPSLEYKQIVSDQKFKEEFINKLKKCLSLDLKVLENQIQVIALKQGSVKVILQIFDFSGPLNSNFEEVIMQFPGTAPSMTLYEYFQTAALSMDDFAPQHNMLWNDYVFGNYDQRGPDGKTQPYFFPVGWHGYALNVAGKYGTNDNWLQMDNNQEEWYVMFHGTNFRGAPNILKQGFRVGSLQAHEKEYCLLTNELIGKGVYFSNHIEVCEGYAESTLIGNEQFVLAFQSRIRPEALRQCKKTSDLTSQITEYKRNNKYQVESLKDMKMWDNDYFVVNNTLDIRPYRILIKQQQTRC